MSQIHIQLQKEVILFPEMRSILKVILVVAIIQILIQVIIIPQVTLVLINHQKKCKNMF